MSSGNDPPFDEEPNLEEDIEDLLDPDSRIETLEFLDEDDGISSIDAPGIDTRVESELRSGDQVRPWESKNDNVYPFPAIVGQDVMKRALILNIINPKIGGVLIRGHKGTGKSIAVRALNEILPEIETFDGCNFQCDPKDPKKWCNDCREKEETGQLRTEMRNMHVVNLPLNITEDMLVGSIDVERVLIEGKKAFEAGLLSNANRNVLYVDEINLLGDNIVDLLLDAAAMGVVTVEREGVSISYQSKFVLIGSMNPEEGELRPQLLDRFPLQAVVSGVNTIEERVDIMENAQQFLQDPRKFREKHLNTIEEIKKKIQIAKELLPKVSTPPKIMEIIANICIDFNVDGHRADIIIERAATTNAAMDGHTSTNIDDVITTSEMALPHRMRKQPFEEEEFSSSMLRKLVQRYTLN
jgi:magnesium chelatase subunit I